MSGSGVRGVRAARESSGALGAYAYALAWVESELVLAEREQRPLRQAEVQRMRAVIDAARESGAAE